MVNSVGDLDRKQNENKVNYPEANNTKECNELPVYTVDKDEAQVPFDMMEFISDKREHYETY